MATGGIKRNRNVEFEQPLLNGHGQRPDFSLRLCVVCARSTCGRVGSATSSMHAQKSQTEEGSTNELRPHSSLDYRTPKEFAETLKKASYGKDADFVCLENAAGVSRFATALTTRQIRRINRADFRGRSGFSSLRSTWFWGGIHFPSLYATGA
jgi:hypothetical protein